MSTANFIVDEHTIACQHVREYPGGTRDGQDQLQLSVKKYVPKHQRDSPAGALTVIAAGGNGFPKELYEPFWDDLLLRSKDGSFSIRAIWIADMAHQGQSGILNSNKLGDDPSWFDYGRDLLQMINHFQDDMPRPIVGVGHSIGATALFDDASWTLLSTSGRLTRLNRINLSLSHPRLLSHLVLLEPILGNCTREGVFFAHFAVQKPDCWPSRSAAESFARKSVPFKTWDGRVIQCWLKHGLMPQPESHVGVRLATSKHQEAVTYVRPLFGAQDSEAGHSSRNMEPRLFDRKESDQEYDSFYCPASAITMARLPELRASVLYVFGSRSVMSPPQKRQEILNSTGSRIDSSQGSSQGEIEAKVLAGQGHLVIFDDPAACAAAVGEHLRGGTKQQERTVVSSFDKGTMQVSDVWRSRAKREVDALLAAKGSRL